jgi:uncharacterized Zn finger protein (UPF0148 family)
MTASIEPAELMSQTCCDDPSPRVGVKSGRMFCGNCRQYLDMPPPAAPEPLSDEAENESTDDVPESIDE